MKYLIDLLKQKVEDLKLINLSLCDEIDEAKVKRDNNWTTEIEYEIDYLRRLRDKRFNELCNLRQSLLHLLQADWIIADAFTPEDESKWRKFDAIK